MTTGNLNLLQPVTELGDLTLIGSVGSPFFQTGRSIVTSADVKYTVLAVNKKKILLLRAGKLCNTFIIGHNPKYENNELTWDYGQYFDCFNKNEGHMLKLAAQAYEEI